MIEKNKSKQKKTFDPCCLEILVLRETDIITTSNFETEGDGFGSWYDEPFTPEGYPNP